MFKPMDKKLIREPGKLRYNHAILIFGVLEKKNLIVPGLQIKGKSHNHFVKFQPKHLLWVLKRIVSMRGFF